MKKYSLMILALTAGTLLHAECNQNSAQCATQKPQVVTAAPAKAEALTTEEQAFAAKLNDQTRKIFADKLTVEQRKSVMAAAKTGANADEAVQKLVPAAAQVAGAEKAHSAEAPAQAK